MKFPKIDIDEKLIISLAKKYKIKELALFGSVLREDFSDKSDIDILIKFTDDNDYSLFDLFEIRDEFEKVLGKEVDLIEKDSLRNPYRRDNIIRNSKVIYAA
jgi:predicted nucleotidyltransferase